MMSVTDSVLATIAYADAFDYALTGEEIYTWIILNSATRKDVKQALRRLSGQNQEGYFVFSGRSSLVSKRKENHRQAIAKWRLVKRIVAILKHIPTIKLVGVTGRLSMDNSPVDDDIDIFFIVADHTLWISRLCATLAVEMFATRRRPEAHSVANTFCLNMFVTESAMTVGESEQDLYAAHEVLQMKPVWCQNGFDYRFLQANKWTRKFLPHAWKMKMAQHSNVIESKVQTDESPGVLLRFFEKVSADVQIMYMKKRRTREVVSDSQLRFHPRDARTQLRQKLTVRLKGFKIPLDKVFSGCIK